MCVSGYDWICVCLDMTGYVCVWICMCVACWSKDVSRVVQQRGATKARCSPALPSARGPALTPLPRAVLGGEAGPSAVATLLVLPVSSTRRLTPARAAVMAKDTGVTH